MKRLLIPVFISLVIAGCGSSPPAKPTTDPCLALHTMGLPECRPPTSLPAVTPTTVATSHPPMPSHTLTLKEVIDHQVGRLIGEEEDNRLFMDTVFRIAFYVFFAILTGMQVYFAYRIRHSRKQVGSGMTTDDEPRLSHKASFRYALFLTVFYAFLMIWAGYGLWTGNLPWFLGIVAIIAAIGFVRQPLRAARKYRPVAIPFSIDLSIQSALADSVTPEYVTGILDNESVMKAIKGDLRKTGQIGYKEVWRLGLITPDQDRFDPRPSQLSLQERMKRAREDKNYRLNLLEQIPLKRTAVLYNPVYFNVQFNNLVVTGGSVKPWIPFYPGWGYSLSTKMTKGDFIHLRNIQVNTDSTSAQNRSRFLPRFLQEDGFPLKESYLDGDPLTTDRGGTIVIDRGKVIIIYPRYFVQRRLINDEGELVDVGLDENFNHDPMFAVKMRPCVFERLIRCITANDYIPVLRYRSVPYASDFMLPILDTPMSISGWADLLIDTRGKAKLFIAKEKTLAEWYQMMNRLRQLFFSELARKDYHLLGLTKDKAHLNHYLSQKQEILKDYYIIQDWELP